MDISGMVIPNAAACFDVDQFGRQFDLQCFGCTDASSDQDCLNNGDGYQTCGPDSACYVSTRNSDGTQSRGCINKQFCHKENGMYVEQCGPDFCQLCYVFAVASPDPARPWSRCITPDPCVDEFDDALALKCLSCTKAVDEVACRNTGTYVTCSPENICYTEYTTEGGIRKETRGCMPINDCTLESLDPLRQEDCEKDVSIANCLICDYFQEFPSPTKPWSDCIVLLPPDKCDANEDLMCLTCEEEQTDEDCRANGVMKRCRDDQICYRLESQTETNVVLISRGCKDVTQCGARALSPTPPGHCWLNGYGHENCLMCDFFDEFPEPDVPWSVCVPGAPPNPCIDENQNEVNLKCWTCNSEPDDSSCNDNGHWEYCRIGHICFRMESTEPDGGILISRGCIPLADCNEEEAVSDTPPGKCHEFKQEVNTTTTVGNQNTEIQIMTTTTCYMCGYFGDSYHECGVALPQNPCETEGTADGNACLFCDGQPSVEACKEDGTIVMCDDLCYISVVYSGEDILVDAGCASAYVCTDNSRAVGGECNTDLEGNKRCVECGYYLDLAPVTEDNEWNRCLPHNPCKVYEDLYCLVLNCTAPPGEELDICELCPDPGHFENCGQTAVCAKISTFDKRGLLVGLRRGCVEIDQCPKGSFEGEGPGVCYPSVYDLAHIDCVQCGYFLDEPPRFHTQGDPWSKCIDRPPDYPCTRPDLLQCLTCYNQPTDDDCAINSFYDFCDGIENATCFRSVIQLPHGQTLITRGCQNRTDCGETLMGYVCSHPGEISDIETCQKCDYFAPNDLLDPAYPWYKCQTPEVGQCICTDTQCWPFDVPKQLLSPGTHVRGHCAYDLIRDDCFQEGPANLTVVAVFDRDEEWLQDAHLMELHAKWWYPPGPVEVRHYPGPRVAVRNYQHDYWWEMPEGDFSALYPFWENVVFAPGVNIYTNYTAMEGEIWDSTDSPLVIITRMPNNMIIKWNGKGTFEIEMPVAYEGEVCGICGNFDGDPDNEDICYGILRSML